MADIETENVTPTGIWTWRSGGSIKVPEPTLETHAATKLYVDANSVQGFWEVNLDDDMQLKTARELQMQSEKIINLADPTGQQDAATKEYVDLNIGGAVDSVFGRTGVIVAVTNDYSWTQINKATSDIADITTKSHTSLSDIGINSHATIDAHLSASNPHSNSTNKTGDTFTGSMTFDDGVGESPRAKFINGTNHEAYISCQATSGDLILDTDTGNIELNAAGDIDAKINKILNVIDPTSNQDAATKKYVDDNAGGASPLTTKGDLFTYSTVDARLGVGTNGYLLTAASGETTGLKWDTLDNLGIVDKTNAQTIAGIKTFSAFPITPSSAPTTDYQVANKKYVDDNAFSGATTINISHGSFSADNQAVLWNKTHEFLQNDDSGNELFYSNVQLPHGETIDSAIAHGDSATDLWIFYKVDSSGTSSVIASTSMNSSVTSIAETIDNTTYSYNLNVRLATTKKLYGFEIGIT